MQSPPSNLPYSTFQSEDNSIVELIFPCNANKVLDIIASFHQRGIVPPNIKYSRSNNSKLYRWPRKGQGNLFPTSYRFLCNSIISTLQQTGRGPTLPLFVHRNIGGIKGFATSSQDERLQVAILVNESWHELVERAAICATHNFTNLVNCELVVVIGVDKTLDETRLLFFHRTFLIASNALSVTTSEGFERFISAIAGLNAWTGNQHGATINMPHLSLPMVGSYEINDVLCEDSLLGHATRTFLAKSTAGSSVSSQPRYNLRNKVNNQPLPSSEHALEFHQDIVTSNPPIHLIVQSFWLSETDVPLGEVWKSVTGAFGIPMHLFSNIVEDTQGKKETTENLIPGDVTFWRAFDDVSVGPKHEIPMLEYRVHVLEGFEGRVRQLSDSRGPRELLEGILHAILGHWNLLQAGYIHCHINDKNILLLDDPEERPAVDAFESTRDTTLCKAVLIGGGQAHRPGDVLQSYSPKFFSEHLCDCLWLGCYEEMQPTALDDLDSFFYVFIFVLFGKLRSRRGVLNQIEERWFNLFDSNKRSLTKATSYYICGRRHNDNSKVMDKLGCILQPWSSLIFEHQIPLRPEEQRESKVVQVAYDKYLQAGFDALDKLPDSWDAFI